MQIFAVFCILAILALSNGAPIAPKPTLKPYEHRDFHQFREAMKAAEARFAAESTSQDSAAVTTTSTEVASTSADKDTVEASVPPKPTLKPYEHRDFHQFREAMKAADARFAAESTSEEGTAVTSTSTEVESSVREKRTILRHLRRHHCQSGCSGQGGCGLGCGQPRPSPCPQPSGCGTGCGLTNSCAPSKVVVVPHAVPVAKPVPVPVPVVKVVHHPVPVPHPVVVPVTKFVPVPVPVEVVKPCCSQPQPCCGQAPLPCSPCSG